MDAEPKDDVVRELMERIGGTRWGWAADELPAVLERLGWTWIEDDDLGVTVDPGPVAPEPRDARVAWQDSKVITTTLALFAPGRPANRTAAGALALGDEFERTLRVAVEVLGPPTARRHGFQQVASWR
ncbi:hypothetical protein KIH74_29160 [Kineosporia sp. J2-2]|uniref:Uncharacterized protein n=1 Tax=Kineosporia corallincola TaxID=2835133 RepID=A0ABS5TQE4_9ACTN|nr:DUF6301 family protein [Kineosporia corallincola]MBT0773048.1 hypothetical protein [Kineosporia corallincola]